MRDTHAMPTQRRGRRGPRASERDEYNIKLQHRCGIMRDACDADKDGAAAGAAREHGTQGACETNCA